MTDTVQNATVHKYSVLAAQLREQIEAGTLKPGDRLPSFVEMRAEFGATPTTVERVHSLLEREGLIQREKRRGVFVAEPATRTSLQTIGLLYSAPIEGQDTYISELIGGLQGVAAEHDYEILILNRPESTSLEKMDGVIAFRQPSESQRDGVHQTSTPATPPWLPAGMPCVAIMLQVDGVPSVIYDEYRGIREAMNHLFGLGHTRVAYLVDKVSRLRMAAYRDAYWQMERHCDEGWMRHVSYRLEGPDYESAAYRDVGEWLKDGWYENGCTALLAQNDQAARGAMEAFRQAGISVPEQVSVVGFDGVGGPGCQGARLTTLEVPLRAIGALGTKLLLQQIQHPRTTVSTVLLPTVLRIGDSTGVAPGLGTAE